MRVKLILIVDPRTPVNFKSLIFIVLTTAMVGMADPETKRKALEIRFENHKFSPQTLVVPADRALQITVLNLSSERIEFESFKLNREKVVEPGASITLKLPPLRAGSYDFFDDFHSDVPEGAIIAK
jgi:Cupredoxin-like domain